MAAIHDLLAQIQDEALRNRIEQEVDRLAKTKKFGLVFEQHLPECTPLYDMPIKVGVNVMRTNDKEEKTLYVVLKLDGNNVICGRKDNPREQSTFDKSEIVRVAEFGEPIYPYLKPIDAICNAPDSDLWHTLIEADNYHALQLLEYLYAGKVDCIYIDPPYNTGAKDWKYNNDYVDGNDAYRHSKWLSMMEKRLRIAKKILNPLDSLLILTIDDKEYLHIGCLLEELFPDARIQMISDIINPAGTMQRKKLPRTDEYLFFVWIGNAEPQEMELDDDWLIGHTENSNRNRYRWYTFIRTASNVSRQKTPSMFYPIFVDEAGKKIISVGDGLDKNVDYRTIIPPEGQRVAFPINTNGREVIWHLSKDSLLEAYQKGYVKLGGFHNGKLLISYLPSGMQAKIENGEIPIADHRDESGAVIFDASEYQFKSLPGTQWRISNHNATEYGTKLLQKFIGLRFSYPKSLYAVRDAISFYVANKPEALILDFFAGSGTTLHAVNLLNAEDNGRRRCILVTNNEVSENERNDLLQKGYTQGSEEWERLGIARYVTWPRTVCTITGKSIDGSEIKGDYFRLDRPMSDGFAANAAFYKLGFLDKTSVALGLQLKEMIPTLWMKAGAIGQCPEIDGDTIPTMMILPHNKFAILVDENYFDQFREKLGDYPEIQTVFLITDYEVNYRSMAKTLGVKTIYQLYRDYLDNFRINHGRN